MSVQSEWWETDRAFTLLEEVVNLAWKEKEEAAKLLQGFSYIPNENSEPPSLKSFIRWLVKEDRKKTLGKTQGKS